MFLTSIPVRVMRNACLRHNGPQCALPGQSSNRFMMMRSISVGTGYHNVWWLERRKSGERLIGAIEAFLGRPAIIRGRHPDYRSRRRFRFRRSGDSDRPARRLRATGRGRLQEEAKKTRRQKDALGGTSEPRLATSLRLPNRRFVVKLVFDSWFSALIFHHWGNS